MWFIGVEVEQETSAPPPKKNPGSAPDTVVTDPKGRHVKHYYQRKKLWLLALDLAKKDFWWLKKISIFHKSTCTWNLYLLNLY